jgi:hypothetical protein
MYIDKDNSGSISIMEISKKEARDFRTILSEFEFLIAKSFLSESDQARLLMISAKIRFQMIDIEN